MKYYIDANGNYLGGWDANPPEGSIEVPFPPEDARYLYIDGVWVPPAKTEEELRAEWKAQRAAAVEAITVTTQAGNTFDGDEVSQGRMSRTILILSGDGTVPWVLTDSTVIEATRTELIEALALAGATQAALWVPQVEQPIVE